jgi:hypothetical protein
MSMKLLRSVVLFLFGPQSSQDVTCPDQPRVGGAIPTWPLINATGDVGGPSMRRRDEMYTIPLLPSSVGI